MEELFEFLFGASGRINRAKYWRSVLIFIGAGLMTALILFTAAGIAAPLFIIMVIVVLIPWLLWGFSFTTKRLHDRDKSAWWLVMFYLLPGVLGQIAKAAWFAGAASTVLHVFGRWQRSRSRSGDSSKSAGCAAPPDPTHMGPTHSSNPNDGAEWLASKNKKSPAAIRPPGGCCNLRNMFTRSPMPARARFKRQLTSTVATIPKTPASASAAMRASS
jgi:uncharacterized membrane protein YhaH (DUF805 family)